MQAIVLAGGQGSRLRPVLDDTPKVMAPIGGRPFLACLLEFLASQGIDSAVLALGHRSGDIARAFGPRFGGLALRYAVEPEPLGTGGALRSALAMIDRFPVFALNGDTYLELDYRAMLAAHRAGAALLTVAVREVADAGRYGRVTVAGGRIAGFEPAGKAQAGLINAGCYLFGENLLADPALPKTFSFERDFLAPRAGALRPLAFETNGYFIDIGVPEDYGRAQRELPARLPKR
jgi:D-glycero-alpha-D-manno-heptose 1-phosphate guanylyltransferase